MASDPVIDLMTRGRKRTFAGILSTQRVSKLAKDAAAEANNVLVGRAVLDVDMKRSGDILGMGSSDARALRTLERGNFWVFGPALSIQVEPCLVGPTLTAPPSPGDVRNAVAPSTPEQIRKILGAIADLPAESAEEVDRLEASQKRIRELENELARLQRSDAAYANAVVKGTRESSNGAHAVRSTREIESLMKEHASTLTKVDRAILATVESLNGIRRCYSLECPPAGSDNAPEVADNVSPNTPSPGITTTPTRVASRSVSQGFEGHDNGAKNGVGGGALRMLRMLASRHPAGFTRRQLAQLKATGGTFGTYFSRLKVAGYIEEAGGLVRTTPAGLEVAGNVEAMPTDPAGMRAAWAEKLGSGPARILQLLHENGGWIERELVAERLAMASGGGTFGTYLSRLATNGLIDKEGKRIRLAEMLAD